jgi:hypothetical protein
MLSMYPLIIFCNASTNVYESWYAYRGNWAHLMEYFIKLYFELVCLYVYPLTTAS